LAADMAIMRKKNKVRIINQTSNKKWQRRTVVAERINFQVQEG
jgi:hypothetical protein